MSDHYFLGGRDLEMLTIRELLEQHQAPYSDKALTWGASASDYRQAIEDCLARGDTPVLVELELDLPIDADRIVVIDHHGERAGADMPSSLRQVFQRLGRPEQEWTRRLRLVDANDREHIRGLQKEQASHREITDIRRQDWRAQGISDAIVEATRETLAEQRPDRTGLWLITLPHDHAGIAADLGLTVFGGPGYQAMCVFSPNEINLYGPGELITTMKAQFPDSWMGGGLPHQGFWGLQRNRHAADIEDLVRARLRDWWTLNKAQMPLEWGDPNTTCASSTQFILPIAYRPWPEVSASNQKQSSLGWHFKRIDLTPPKTGEDPQLLMERQRYFTEESGAMIYHHAAWFELQPPAPDKDQSGDHHQPTTAQHRLSATFQSTQRQVELILHPARLVLFNWDTACIKPDNSRRKKADDQPAGHRGLLSNGHLIVEISAAEPLMFIEVLELNEHFRYVQSPFQKFYEEFFAEVFQQQLNETLPWCNDSQQWFSEQSIAWQKPSVAAPASEAAFFGKWLSLLALPLCDGDGSPAAQSSLWRLAPPEWFQRTLAHCRHESWDAGPHLFKCTDTKAFVWTSAIAAEAHGHQLERFEVDTQAAPSRPQPPRWRRGDWIKLVNVDRPSKGQPHGELLAASNYEQRWIEEQQRTYTRWAHYGTLYGASSHSCAMLSTRSIEPPLWQHFRLFYRDQGLFLLYVRATLFRFNRALSGLTQQEMRNHSSDRKNQLRKAYFQQSFEHLRKQFAQFANLYQFPLLSNEQQGLEMYQIQRRMLDIDILYKEVNSQIHAAHELINLQQQHESLHLTTVIAILGIPLLIASLFAGLFGMDLSMPWGLVEAGIKAWASEPLMSELLAAKTFILAALWLMLVLVILVPLRLLENRIIDLRKRGLKIINRWGMALVFVVAIGAALLWLPAVLSLWAVAGFALIFIIMGGWTTLTKKLIAARQAWCESSSAVRDRPESKDEPSPLQRITNAFRQWGSVIKAAWEAFWQPTPDIISAGEQLEEMIDTEIRLEKVKKSEISNNP
ncbi:MAG: hypothetical protein Tsb002_21910 [Wenzhouxiangellaceae bacterium]